MSGTICHSYAKVSPTKVCVLNSDCAECVRIDWLLIYYKHSLYSVGKRIHIHTQTRAQAAATALRC
jgi:hypothetical protein